MTLHCSTFFGHPCREDGAESPSFLFSLSGPHVKKVLRKYHQNAFQPFAYRAWFSKKRLRRLKAMASSAPLENGLQCHDPSTTDSNTEIDHRRRMLDASLDCNSTDIDMLQALHETARMFLVAIEKEGSLTKGPWFTKAWLGVDHNAWIKSIAYQAAVHALIEAVLDIARRQESRSSFVSSMVQKSLFRLRVPLVESIRHHICARDPVSEAWLWNQQHPVAVNNLLSNLKEGSRYDALETVDRNEASQSLMNKGSGSALFMLSLSTFASIMKLGSGKLSCPAFSSSLAEEIGYLMEGLADISSIEQVFYFTSTIGLKDKFLNHFGSRAALQDGDLKVNNQERLFWVGLIEKSLRSSFAREGVCSKLASSTQFEVLDRSLAVFAFFTAFGRKARSFLLSRRVQIEDHLLSLFRCLEGGYVIFFPELATLTTYQLFVEVASEDLEWLPFFEKDGIGTSQKSKSKKDDMEQLPSDEEAAEAIAVVLNVCSYWVDDFIAYSGGGQQAQTAEVTKFLSNIQSVLCECITTATRKYRRSDSNKNLVTRAATEMEQFLQSLIDEDLLYKSFVEKAKSVYQTLEWGRTPKDSQTSEQILVNIDLYQLQEQLKAFDKDLHMVEKVLSRLEGLLTGSDLSKLQIGNIQLMAIKLNLQKIQSLKSEAQALERSLQHKAFIKKQQLIEQQLRLQQGYDQQESEFYRRQNISNEHLPQQQTRKEMSEITLTQDSAPDSLSSMSVETVVNNEAQISNVLITSQKAFDVSSEKAPVSEEVAQLGAMQCELYQLDFRIREYAGETRSDEAGGMNMSLGDTVATGEKYKAWELLSKSTKKLKDVSMDVLKGTQLLVTDIAVAMTLIRSRFVGHNLTEREKRILRRTCTDLASVIPIGILMLLPVTAVGHAAMLAAIQKYVPALIPSAYASERLDLFKQLEQLKEMGGDAPSNQKLPSQDLCK